MSLLLLFLGGQAPQINGTGAAVQGAALVAATGTMQEAAEVIFLSLPIQSVISLNLSVGLAPATIVPPWSTRALEFH